ncbi:hypothetical protein HJG44_12735 [Enterovirga sp. DB1703]|uniref:Uncharacterized protein n=1 Tax=Enterovirga aerilata TaxID=2730920 RepID=A0A849IB92_9HYPH|nr:hypothetical protein [Enterovirga sp. DB1703]
MSQAVPSKRQVSRHLIRCGVEIIVLVVIAGCAVVAAAGPSIYLVLSNGG